MNGREQRAARCMWWLGFAAALVLDGILFDGYPIWLGAPMLLAVAYMTVLTVQRRPVAGERVDQS